MAAPLDLPVMSFGSAKQFETWLKKHHAKVSGIWLRFYKKDSGVKTVVYAEALDVALCYGWIDSQVKKYDALSYVQRFTVRGKRSVWSLRNTEHVARLIKTGSMQPAGLATVEEAKKDGRWQKAYASPKNTTLPTDFKKALSANPKAYKYYKSLNRTNTFAFIVRLAFVKKPETRARKITEFVKMLAQGKKLY